MEINKNNYEAYFLDLLEGNLSDSLKEELDLFLSQHPELKVELEDFELIELESEKVSNDSLKASLLREESTGLTEIDYLLISEVEGTINEKEKKKLKTLLVANPSLQKDLRFYQKAKLSSNEQFVFPNKSALIQKKQVKVVYLFRHAAAVAAAILAFVWFNIGSVDEQYNPRTAQKIIVSSDEVESVQFPNIAVKDAEQELDQVQNDLPVYEPINEDRTFAQVEEPKEEEPEEKPNQEIQLPEEEFAEVPALEKQKQEFDMPDESEELAMVSEEKEQEIRAEDRDYTPIDQYAKKLILKDKTVSETLSEELADLSNNKINFERVKNKEGKIEQFALNIGKLSISRKK